MFRGLETSQILCIVSRRQIHDVDNLDRELSAMMNLVDHVDGDVSEMM